MVEAQEQPGAGAGHHNGVPLAGRVLLDEGSDEPQNLGVSSFAGDDVADREADMADAGHRRDGSGGWE